jgi:2-furoate---CoA ligase
MLDLGTTFLASVARDPDAPAIVDGALRLSYAEWYQRISAVVAGLDELGLAPGDHIVSADQSVRSGDAALGLPICRRHHAAQLAGER